MPFLDNDLVDFAMKLPTRFKLGKLDEVVAMNENEGREGAGYLQRTNDGKLLLRNVMKRYMPEQVAEREKQGFSAPDASWFKGESMAYIRTTLQAGTARIWNYLDQRSTGALIEEHLEGKQKSTAFDLVAALFRGISEGASLGPVIDEFLESPELKM